MHRRATALVCFAVLISTVAFSSPAVAASPPGPPQLVSPTLGSSVPPGSNLTVRLSDLDDSPLDVTFHAAARGSTDPEDTGSPFTFVTIPDTQGYTITSTYIGVLNDQLQWIVDNRSNLNIAFATGLGDIVDNQISPKQWNRATTSMAILDEGGIPHAVLPGNHDFDTATGDFAGYNAHFPVSRYRNAGWNSATARYGGYYGQDEFGPDAADRQNMNSYSLFHAGGMDFILIALELNAPDGVLAWANRVLQAHPNDRAIIATHSYLFTTGNLSNELKRTDIQANTGAQIFQKLVYPNCNVFLVVNGHFPGEANRVNQNACGKPVYAALTDFQARGNGGDGWLRYYRFDPAQDTITAVTYSPYRGEYETDANSSFTMAYDMETTLDLPVIAQRTVDSGATVSVPVPEFPDGTVLDWYVTVSDGTATTRSPTWSTRVLQAPVSTTLVSDSFSRSVSSGWGTADAGGAWAVNSTSKLSVQGGVGRVSANAGSTLTATLNAIDATSVDARTAVTLDRIPNQTLHLTFSPRQVGTSSYNLRARVLPTGAISLDLLRDGTTLASQTLPNGTVTANTPIHLRVQADGTSPTQLRGRAWRDGTPEPSAWQVTAIDNTGALQQSGALRLTTYLSSSATNGPVIVSYDNLVINRIGETEPPPNQPPVAAFSSTMAGLTVSVDAAASSDPNGMITSYAWDWGDNTAASSGRLASHTYAAAGPYTITLLVTDDYGATHTTTESVIANDPPPPVAQFLIKDDFGRTATSSWGSADIGGAWAISGGSVAAASVASGQAQFSLMAGSTRTGLLAQTPLTTYTAQVDFSASATPETGGAYVGFIARNLGSNSAILHAWLRPNGTVWLVAQRGSTVLQTYAIPGLSYHAGEEFTLKVEVTVGATTQLRSKLWRVGTSEPLSWQLAVSDGDPALRVAGSLGLRASRSSTATSAVVVTFDGLVSTSID